MVIKKLGAYDTRTGTVKRTIFSESISYENFALAWKKKVHISIVVEVQQLRSRVEELGV